MKTTVLMLCLAPAICYGDTYVCEQNGKRTISSEPCAIGQRTLNAVPRSPTQHQVTPPNEFSRRYENLRQNRYAIDAQQQGEYEVKKRASDCTIIDDELRRLQEKYTSWTYVPVPEVNADQARERDLKAKRANLHCGLL